MASTWWMEPGKTFQIYPRRKSDLRFTICQMASTWWMELGSKLLQLQRERRKEARQGLNLGCGRLRRDLGRRTRSRRTGHSRPRSRKTSMFAPHSPYACSAFEPGMEEELEDSPVSSATFHPAVRHWTGRAFGPAGFGLNAHSPNANPIQCWASFSQYKPGAWALARRYRGSPPRRLGRPVRSARGPLTAPARRSHRESILLTLTLISH